MINFGSGRIADIVIRPQIKIFWTMENPLNLETRKNLSLSRSVPSVKIQQM